MVAPFPPNTRTSILPWKPRLATTPYFVKYSFWVFPAVYRAILAEDQDAPREQTDEPDVSRVRRHHLGAARQLHRQTPSRFPPGGLSMFCLFTAVARSPVSQASSDLAAASGPTGKFKSLIFSHKRYPLQSLVLVLVFNLAPVPAFSPSFGDVFLMTINSARPAVFSRILCSLVFYAKSKRAKSYDRVSFAYLLSLTSPRAALSPSRCPILARSSRESSLISS